VKLVATSGVCLRIVSVPLADPAYAVSFTVAVTVYVPALVGADEEE